MPTMVCETHSVSPPHVTKYTPTLAPLSAYQFAKWALSPDRQQSGKKYLLRTKRRRWDRVGSYAGFCRLLFVNTAGAASDPGERYNWLLSFYSHKTPSVCESLAQSVVNRGGMRLGTMTKTVKMLSKYSRGGVRVSADTAEKSGIIFCMPLNRVTEENPA